MKRLRTINPTFPVAVHVVLQRGSRVLLLLRQQTGFHDGEWSLPAGRVEEGETLRGAAVRETAEEISVVIRAEDLGVPCVMHHRDARGERLYFFFSCRRWEGKPQNCESERCAAVRWVQRQRLPRNTIPHIRVALAAMLHKQCYVEYGFSG